MSFTSDVMLWCCSELGSLLQLNVQHGVDACGKTSKAHFQLHFDVVRVFRARKADPRGKAAQRDVCSRDWQSTACV